MTNVSPPSRSRRGPSGESPSADAPFSLHGLPFPARLGPFVRGGVRDYEADAPGLGHSVAYHLDMVDDRDGCHSRASVTVYLYPAVALPEPPDGSEAAVSREAGLVLEELQHAVDTGFYAAVSYRTPCWSEIGDAARFLVMELLVRPRALGCDEEPQYGAVCLMWLRGRFLKIRITSLAEEDTREHAVRFPAALLMAFGLCGVVTGPAGHA